MSRCEELMQVLERKELRGAVYGSAARKEVGGIEDDFTGEYNTKKIISQVTVLMMYH